MTHSSRLSGLARSCGWSCTEMCQWLMPIFSMLNENKSPCWCLYSLPILKGPFIVNFLVHTLFNTKNKPIQCVYSRMIVLWHTRLSKTATSPSIKSFWQTRLRQLRRFFSSHDQWSGTTVASSQKNGCLGCLEWNKCVQWMFLCCSCQWRSPCV